MSIFTKWKNRERRIDRLSYNFTLSDFWEGLSNLVSEFGPYAFLAGVMLGACLIFLIEGDGKLMSDWFSHATENKMQDIAVILLVGGFSSPLLSAFISRVIAVIFGLFRRELHNYTVLMFFVSTILVALQKNYGFWLGFAAIPSAIFLIMLGVSIVVGILDLIF